jgi:ABC-2 type transport system permease protein
MLASPFTKALRDRWISVAVASVGMGLMLLGGMAVYRNLDLSIYQDLPDGVRELFGFSDVNSVGQLAYGAIYSFMAALALAGVAISIGSSSVAGEERNGTMGILLGNPESRSRLLGSKTAALATLVVAGALTLWAAALLAPELLGVDISDIHIGALMLHMLAISLFFGMLALTIGACSGSPSAASGGSAAVLIVSYLASSVLPLVGLDGLARFFPWFYFNGSDPLNNGADPGHLAILFGGSALLAVIALAGFRRRDLRERTVGVSLVDRRRDNPATHAVIERLEGSARVSGIFVKTVSAHQGLLAVTGLIVAALGVWMGPMYSQIDQNLATLTGSLPDSVLALIGNADMSTPEGWLTGEMFSLTVPVATITVGVVIGARALAGEEKQRTMSLLLANPVSRSRIVLTKAAAMLLHLFLLGLIIFGGVLLGSWLGGLGVSAAGLAGLTLLATLLGAVFGSLALGIGAATGRVPVATYAAAGAAALAYIANSMLSLSSALGDLARLSPFFYYLTGDPLVNGLQWGHAAALGGLTGALVAASMVLFNRRDLR